MECIRSKSETAKKRDITDEKLLSNYVKYHSKSCRVEKCAANGKRKKVNGAYVENEMICAVAHQNNIIINVAHCQFPMFSVITPNGQYVSVDDPRAEASPFFLWCTGGHYQALVKLQDVEVRSSALAQPAFTLSNCLQSADVREVGV